MHNLSCGEGGNSNGGTTSCHRTALQGKPIHRQVRRAKVPAQTPCPAGTVRSTQSASEGGALPEPVLQASTMIRRVVTAKTAVRASIPSLIEKAARNALRERTLRRGEPAHPAVQARTVSSRELATCTSCPSGQGSLPGSSSCVTCNDQPWTWQKCNNNRCPKAANAERSRRLQMQEGSQLVERQAEVREEVAPCSR